MRKKLVMTALASQALRLEALGFEVSSLTRQRDTLDRQLAVRIDKIESLETTIKSLTDNEKRLRARLTEGEGD